MNIINIKNCNVWLGLKKVLDGFSLSVDSYQHTAIIGPNGSGKSTFIRLLTREIYPSRFEGENPEIEILGKDNWNIFELRKKISLVSPKFSEALLTAVPLNVSDAVSSSFLGTYGFYAGDSITPQQEKLAAEMMQKLNLEALKNHPIDELSTGQLRKVLIARAMVLEPEIILLDEPTSGLDIYAQAEFLEFIRSILKHTTVILVTHHLEEVLPEMKKILLIKEGRIFRFGEKEEILNEMNLSELFDTKIKLDRSESGIYSMRRA